MEPSRSSGGPESKGRKANERIEQQLKIENVKEGTPNVALPLDKSGEIVVPQYQQTTESSRKRQVEIQEQRPSMSQAIIFHNQHLAVQAKRSIRAGASPKLVLKLEQKASEAKLGSQQKARENKIVQQQQVMQAKLEQQQKATNALRDTIAGLQQANNDLVKKTSDQQKALNRLNIMVATRLEEVDWDVYYPIWDLKSHAAKALTAIVDIGIRRQFKIVTDLERLAQFTRIGDSTVEMTNHLFSVIQDSQDNAGHSEDHTFFMEDLEVDTFAVLAMLQSDKDHWFVAMFTRGVDDIGRIFTFDPTERYFDRERKALMLPCLAELLSQARMSPFCDVDWEEDIYYEQCVDQFTATDGIGIAVDIIRRLARGEDLELLDAGEREGSKDWRRMVLAKQARYRSELEILITCGLYEQEIRTAYRSRPVATSQVFPGTHLSSSYNIGLLVADQLDSDPPVQALDDLVDAVASVTNKLERDQIKHVLGNLLSHVPSQFRSEDPNTRADGTKGWALRSGYGRFVTSERFASLHVPVKLWPPVDNHDHIRLGFTLIVSVVRFSGDVCSEDQDEHMRNGPERLMRAHHARFSAEPRLPTRINCFSELRTTMEIGKTAWTPYTPVNTCSCDLQFDSFQNHRQCCLLDKIFTRLSLHAISRGRREKVCLVTAGWDGFTTAVQNFLDLEDHYPGLVFHMAHNVSDECVIDYDYSRRTRTNAAVGNCITSLRCVA